ncbi:unnamed protein product [Arabis nemorensis]|uniref:Uncharacterized protein n=1 Tax=Arabis nemorensis TaxID=586526 RepID=A0A565AZ81_9BRAS|nr:unnamed protein product [Arabis nemorensis]
MTKLLQFLLELPDLKLAAVITQPSKPPDPPRLLVSGDIILSRILPLSSYMERLHLTSYSFMEVSLQQVYLSVDLCCPYSLLMMTSSNNGLFRIGVMGTIPLLGKLAYWNRKPLFQFSFVDYLNSIIGFNPPFSWSVVGTIQPCYSIRCVMILPRLEGSTSIVLVSWFETSCIVLASSSRFESKIANASALILFKDSVSQCTSALVA